MRIPLGEITIDDRTWIQAALPNGYSLGEIIGGDCQVFFEFHKRAGFARLSAGAVEIFFDDNVYGRRLKSIMTRAPILPAVVHDYARSGSMLD